MAQAGVGTDRARHVRLRGEGAAGARLVDWDLDAVLDAAVWWTCAVDEGEAARVVPVRRGLPVLRRHRRGRL